MSFQAHSPTCLVSRKDQNNSQFWTVSSGPWRVTGCTIWWWRHSCTQYPSLQFCHTQISWYMHIHRHSKSKGGLIHIEIANKTQQCIRIYYSMFIWSSTCFGRHTAHHQEPKTALAASGFAYVKGCSTLRLLDAGQRPATTHPTTLHVCKTRGC